MLKFEEYLSFDGWKNLVLDESEEKIIPVLGQPTDRSCAEPKILKFRDIQIGFSYEDRSIYVLINFIENEKPKLPIPSIDWPLFGGMSIKEVSVLVESAGIKFVVEDCHSLPEYFSILRTESGLSFYFEKDGVPLQGNGLVKIISDLGNEALFR